MGKRKSPKKTGEEVGSFIIGLIVIYIVCMIIWGATTANWVVGLILLAGILILLLNKIPNKDILYSYTEDDGTIYHVTTNTISSKNPMSLPDDYTELGAWREPVYTFVNILPSGMVATCGDAANTLYMDESMVHDAIKHAPNTIPVHRIVTNDHRPLRIYPWGSTNGQKDMLIREGVRFNSNGQALENHVAIVSSRPEPDNGPH
jgi:alkylated DNA nucleotide flippase Atl1